MYLGDLPNELFLPVIHELIRISSIIECAKYRLVCRAFNENITDAMIDRACRYYFWTLPLLPERSKFFHAFGNKILYGMIYKGYGKNSRVLRFIQHIVNFIIKEGDPKDEAYHEDKREILTQDICNAMMGLDPEVLFERLISTHPNQVPTPRIILPAIAAAIGDDMTLQNSVRNAQELLVEPSRLFPNALHAAVAANKCDVLRFQLDYIDCESKGLCGTKTSEVENAATMSIVNALKIAIRMHRSYASQMLFDALKRPTSAGELPLEVHASGLLMDCIRHGCVDLFYNFLDLVLKVRPIAPAIGPPNRYTLDRTTMNSLLKFGSLTIWIRLLQDCQIDPNEGYNGHTLVSNALTRRRRGLAKVLLDRGANIEGVADKPFNHTALWDAANNRYYMNVKFLLERRARPDHEIKEYCPLQIAKEKQHNKCIFLLTKYKEHGKDYLQRSDLWAMFDEWTARGHI